MLVGSSEALLNLKNLSEEIREEVSAIGYKLSIRSDVDSNLYKPFYDFACDTESCETIYYSPQTQKIKNTQIINRNCFPLNIELLGINSNELVGCVASTIYYSGEIDSNQVLEVDFLAISPKMQRRGLGTLLMKSLIETVQQSEVKKIVLEPKDIAEEFYTKKLNMRRIILPNADIQMELVLRK